MPGVNGILRRCMKVNFLSLTVTSLQASNVTVALPNEMIWLPLHIGKIIP